MISPAPRTLLLVALSAALGAAACAPDAGDPAGATTGPRFAERATPVAADAPPAQIAQIVKNVNARLEKGGSQMRLAEVWLFTAGAGTDPFRTLRIGSRWPYRRVGYYLDAKDFTKQPGAGDVAAGLTRSYSRWNAVKASAITVGRVPLPDSLSDAGNWDILDGRVENAKGECVDIIDLTAQNLNPETGTFFPVADIVVGGWMPNSWFADCLGSGDIIGITFTFSVPDSNGDQYADIVYVEQYFNDGFTWLAEGAPFLNPFVPDLESIATHEDGHALGLGHFGGAGKVNDGTFASENFRMVFSPVAIMNGGYLGGVNRELYGTDEAALRALY